MFGEEGVAAGTFSWANHGAGGVGKEELRARGGWGGRWVKVWG